MSEHGGRLVVLTWVLAVGCAGRHVSDGGPPDGAAACTLGPYAGCWEGCAPCPEGTTCDLVVKICREHVPVGEYALIGCYYGVSRPLEAGER